MKKTKIDHYTDKEALDFHKNKKPGKIEIISSKNMTTKRDLALAYSPGVAAPVRMISENPDLLTIIGGLTANFLGRGLLRLADRLIRQIPMAGTVYTALRQIFQTAVREDGASFSQVALIEYPRKGLNAIAFITKAADRRVNDATGKAMIGVFLPTTPNPTSGFLLFVPEDELTILDMTVEEGARLVISAGLADEESDSDS